MDHQPSEIGDWLQISILGSGAFGTVMLWCNRIHSDFVAIKKCKFQKKNALSPKQKERWHLEVEFLKSINHPNIIGYKKLDPILEEMINKYNPTRLPLLSMEYCKKGNLRRYITSEPIKLCGLQEQDIRDILEDISGGLSYLHTKNITHRDIKPDNIVLQNCDGRRGGTLYKIIDLGYAKELEDPTLSFVGTLQYLAPEIFYNGTYNSSVDYWSFGIMIFEVICGVLPFLPEWGPYESFEKIKKKNSEDICIYLSYSGAVTYVSELRKEHFVTSCFKQNIESWLRRVLQFDSVNRTFSNGISAFEYLRYILDKKIVQVFSVYKLEFYSYEISEGTLLGTLKDWISRDIKVNKNDFMLLFGNKPNVDLAEEQTIWSCNDDETLVESLLRNEDTIIYVYKRDTVFSEKLVPKVPNLLKESFTDKFQMKFLRQLYRQALFFVYSELQLADYFKLAYINLIKHIEDLCDEVSSKYGKATEILELLMMKIKEFLEKIKGNNLRCDNNNIDLGYNRETIECLKYFERVLSSVERRERSLREFGVQARFVEHKKTGIEEARTLIRNIFAMHNLTSQFDRINVKGFLELQKDEKPEVALKKITNVISETLKLKCNLFMKNNDLKNYSSDFCHLLKSAEQLVTWINDFVYNIEQLLDDFVAMSARYDQIFTEALNKKKKEVAISFVQEDCFQIIKENKLLRCQFEDILSGSVLAHKNYVEDFSDLLT